MTEMDAQDPEGMTKMELDLRLSLFREGLRQGFNEMSGNAPMSNPLALSKKLNDADWAHGYSIGSRIAELAMENYRQMLLGGGK